MSPAAPELKKFQLLEMVGSGGMGYVYAGYDLKTEKPVAVKVLSSECAKIEALLSRFKIEGKILQSLNHPHVVKYVDAGNDGGWHYLAMEFVKGVSMDSLPMSHSASTMGLEQNLPSIEEYIFVFSRCMAALGYIHLKGLVHQDIKPQNIILRGEALSPVFIDFGIAKYLKDDDDMHLSTERMFTMVYASPEQLTNKPVDIRSDLFSFGVLMYEKLTGQLPFLGKREMEVFLAQAKWNFPPPRQLNPSIPKKLEEIILRLISRDPDHRYPSADMVQGELERLLDVIRSKDKGLTMSGILTEIREMPTPEGARKTGKRNSLSDDINAMKRARNEYVEAKNQLKSAASKLRTDPERIEEVKAIAESFRQEYERLQQVTKMSLGFRSQPLVIDRFNSIMKMDTLVFEKKGVPFTINTIEQKLAFSDGGDIVVGSTNLTEKTKRFYSLNHRDTFLTWDESNWFFNAYEEKDFPIYIMVGEKKTPFAPPGFKGFYWPFEFIVAIHKLNKTGVAIVETFNGVDRNGTAGFGTHKETILFSQNMFEQFKQPSPPPKP
jgi:serine/threonine protein kinase